MKRHILLIDDDDAIVSVMQEVLELEGYKVTGITVTEDVCSLVRRTGADLVIVDYLLTGTNGGELCRQLRKCPDPAHRLPLVLMSAYARELLPLNNIPHDVFFAKPFDLWEFLAAIEKLFNLIYAV